MICKQQGEAATRSEKLQARVRSHKQEGEATSRREKLQAGGRSNIYLTSLPCKGDEKGSNQQYGELGFSCGKEGKEALR